MIAYGSNYPRPQILSQVSSSFQDHHESTKDTRSIFSTTIWNNQIFVFWLEKPEAGTAVLQVIQRKNSEAQLMRETATVMQ